MKPPRHSSYPMAVEDMMELADELSEFGSDNPDEADRRYHYKVERGSGLLV